MSKQEISEVILSCAEKLGRTPSIFEVMKMTPVTRRQIRLHFGSFTHALRECNLERETSSGQKVPLEKLFVDWAGVVRQTGKAPSMSEYEALSKYSCKPLTRCFGSWKQVAYGLTQFAERRGLAEQWRAELAMAAEKPGDEDEQWLKQREGEAMGSALPGTWGKATPGTWSNTPNAWDNGLPGTWSNTVPISPLGVMPTAGAGTLQPAGSEALPITEPSTASPAERSTVSPAGPSVVPTAGANTPSSKRRALPSGPTAGPTYGPPMWPGPLAYSPTNELGVVFLFGWMAQALGFVVHKLQPEFPDCEAMRRVAEDLWQYVRIEFEFESRNFLKHMHDAKQCDLIICWRHNWPECPVEVVELRSLLPKLFASR